MGLFIKLTPFVLRICQSFRTFIFTYEKGEEVPPYCPVALFCRRSLLATIDGAELHEVRHTRSVFPISALPER